MPDHSNNPDDLFHEFAKRVQAGMRNVRVLSTEQRARVREKIRLNLRHGGRKSESVRFANELEMLSMIQPSVESELRKLSKELTSEMSLTEIAKEFSVLLFSRMQTQLDEDQAQRDFRQERESKKRHALPIFFNTRFVARELETLLVGKGFDRDASSHAVDRILLVSKSLLRKKWLAS